MNLWNWKSCLYQRWITKSLGEFWPMKCCECQLIPFITFKVYFQNQSKQNKWSEPFLEDSHAFLSKAFSCYLYVPKFCISQTVCDTRTATVQIIRCTCMFNVIIAVVAVHNVQYYHYCVSISNKQEKVNMMGRRRKGTSVKKKIHTFLSTEALLSWKWQLKTQT